MRGWLLKTTYASLCWLVVPLAFASGEGDCGLVYETNSETGKTTLRMQLRLHPQAAPKPVLKHRLIPDPFEMNDGTAAVYYLRAMGFFEQENARDQLSEFRRKSREQAEVSGDPLTNYPPYNWLEMTPDELPREEVKQYLQLLSMQPSDLERARSMRHFSMDRNLRDEDNPLLVLLPEIQVMRELARNQSLRCRMAIAEGDFDAALKVVGQQFSLAKHLSQDPFLVSNLVGTAIAHIAWVDFLHLVQMPNAENRYWALATLPKPLVDISESLANERQFLFLQVKSLLYVTEEPKPNGYWVEFIDRHLEQLIPLGVYELNLPQIDDPQARRAAFVTVIAAAYPGARAYLIEDLGMDGALVDQYPIAQTVFLAERRFYEHARDEFHKWFYVPSRNIPDAKMRETIDQRFRDEAARVGFAALPSVVILPAVPAAAAAMQRLEVVLAMLQTVEAIRMYGAANDGQLPPNLNELTVPAPLNPLTGMPFEYRVSGNQATLTANVDNLIYELQLTF